MVGQLTWRWKIRGSLAKPAWNRLLSMQWDGCNTPCFAWNEWQGIEDPIGKDQRTVQHGQLCTSCLPQTSWLRRGRRKSLHLKAEGSVMIADAPGPKTTSICWWGIAKHKHSRNFLEFIENYFLLQVINDPMNMLCWTCRSQRRGSWRCESQEQPWLQQSRNRGV